MSIKKYYLAADGGGSKLITILYDNEFNVVNSAKTDGTNILFKPSELVHSNIDKMLDKLIPDYIDEIESVDFCIVGTDGYFDKAVKNKIKVNRMKYHGESHIGLGACFKTEGILAIAGTGSAAVLAKNDKYVASVGGWGPLLGDEGSGYDIGLRSIKAAIYSSDGRRPKTILKDMIVEHFKIERLYDIINLLNYDPDSRHVIASVAKITSKAAALGDAVAIDIYRHAAKEIYRTTKAVINKVGGSFDVPIAIMGGAWKGSDVMVNTYADLIYSKYPNVEFVKPYFEPVVGCVIRRCLSEGMEMEEIREIMSDKFSQYRINW